MHHYTEDRLKAVVAALCVVTRDRRIRSFLEDTDPKALAQARDALLGIGHDPDPVPPKRTTDLTLRLIADALDGQQWTPGHLELIANYLREAGFTIREPGELDDEQTSATDVEVTLGQRIAADVAAGRAFMDGGIVFRKLTPEEDKTFREWAEHNDPAPEEDWAVAHPVVREVWRFRGFREHGNPRD